MPLAGEQSAGGSISRSCRSHCSSGTSRTTPAISAIFWSFFHWQPAADSTFLGIDNYVTMFSDQIWWSSFRNLGIIFLFSVVAWVFPLLAAELLISLRSPRWQFTMRTILIVPMAFPGVVTALVWGFFYSPNDGVINQALKALGLEALAQNWTGQASTALLSLLFVGFPFIAGLPFLIFYSSLQNIPTEVLEAAQLDGVGRFARFWQIDLPLMASQVRILVFLAIVGTLQYGFVAYVLTSGGPDNATMVPILRMINVAFQGGDWGYSAALSTTLFVITMIISAVVIVARRRDSSTADGGAM
ncbi:carbohydrate ABC transporter permease [Microbacterium murale]|uniref:Raffinose/stachyose/melibiose transport system permease protein n=1 Tax=Microbacterium murale TaxID=1081040 RepID=A0ABU0P5P5_9MICO|nr:sugar ABC transporter permease [Microbacterium murale]MDQ0642650.1 raffinose/stachyose/melibiose transport system permease protein [Microbacterium murale]